jgi:hypothetical protein
MRGVIRLLVEKGVVTGDELEEMVGGDGGGELP